MRIRERTAWTSIDVQDSFIGRKARQHDVATGGKLRNAFRDGAAISNQLLRLAVILVISGQLEARLKKPPRNGLAHVANSDKSKLIVFRRDWIHSGFSFGRGPYEFRGKCLCAFGPHSHGPLLLSSVFSAPITGECKRLAKNRSRARQMAFICKPLNRNLSRRGEAIEAKD